MTKPRTEAGRTFLAALQASDALQPDLPPVDWAHGILAIEAEAAPPSLDGLARALHTIKPSWGTRYCDEKAAAILAALREGETT